HANAKIDPLPNVWTGTWQDPRFSPPADGGKPQNALTGTLFMVNSGTAAIQVPSSASALRFWRNTSVASLAPGATATLAPETLGYEWDEDRDNGFRPPGLIRLSDTTVSGVEYLQDYGSNYATATANHALTLYRHSSGALVFGAGTIQWQWGLAEDHDGGSAHVTSLAMKQATMNLFADMGVQPLTRQAGLVPASPSVDTLKPTSHISVPANGATVNAYSAVTISGTATDNGGGQVAGVEVSVDGGATWNRATGRSSWTYTWQTGPPRSVTLLSRAVDDSGNLEQPASGNAVTVQLAAGTCPCSIWTASQGPTSPNDDDPSSVELGTRFRTDIDGYITGIRYYKSAADTGAHIGNLWTETGVNLATVNFSGGTSTGWQTATLATPVQISAFTTYVVSYHTDTGNYFGQDEYFVTTGVDNGPLHAPRSGDFGPNGVYRYGSSGFPTNTSNGENYWADVVFVTAVGPDTTPPIVTNVQPASGAGNVAPTTSVTAFFNEAMAVATINTTNFELRDAGNALVSATVTYDAVTRSATLQPSAPLAYETGYTARVKGGSSGVTDKAGNPLAADFVWPFATAAAPKPPPWTGPGGPILVISAPSNPFTQYYAEILRAEGLNEFSVVDMSTVTASTLNGYDVVILGEMSLTPAQVTMLSNWVNAGGNLIAMRPDKQLASLLGLTDAGTTLADGYMLVDTSAAPGTGIVTQTMQFHGVADRYSLSGAASIATL
ncbi:MAG TPA: DUF4082 domain-containing protein, partial [Micromonosporaceae bacterium]